MKMSADDWLEGHISTGGHFADTLKHVPEDDITSLYAVLGHAQWLIRSYCMLNTIPLKDEWKDLDLYDKKF